MDRRARMAATPARRVRFLLSGVLALAVLTGGGLYLARSELFAGPASSRATVNPRATAAGCDAAFAAPLPISAKSPTMAMMRVIIGMLTCSTFPRKRVLSMIRGI